MPRSEACTSLMLVLVAAIGCRDAVVMPIERSASEERASGPVAFAASAAAGLVQSITRAPVSPDGDVAGARPDFVINLDAPLDPLVPGRALAAGKTIRVTLPDAFERDPSVPLLTFASPGCTIPVPLTCNTVILLQGWPQRPVVPFSLYPLSADGSHTIVLTATAEIVAQPPLSPGIKQIHLLLNGYRNPHPGAYRILVEAETGPGGTFEAGEGQLVIRPRGYPSANVTNLLFAPPGLNSNYQVVPTSTQAARPFDLLLWDANGEPLLGVRYEPLPAQEGARGGNLVLDGRVVGKVRIDAPSRAQGQRLLVATASSQANAPVTGTPAGLLRAYFVAGSEPGEYHVTFSLAGGNDVRLLVRVT